MYAAASAIRRHQDCWASRTPGGRLAVIDPDAQAGPGTHESQFLRTHLMQAPMHVHMNSAVKSAIEAKRHASDIVLRRPTATNAATRKVRTGRGHRPGPATDTGRGRGHTAWTHGAARGHMMRPQTHGGTRGAVADTGHGRGHTVRTDGADRRCGQTVRTDGADRRCGHRPRSPAQRRSQAQIADTDRGRRQVAVANTKCGRQRRAGQ
jgi:hypothetical protein